MKKIILLDMDGVIVDLGSEVMRYIKRNFGKYPIVDAILPIEQHTSFDFSKNVDLEKLKLLTDDTRAAKASIKAMFNRALTDSDDNIFDSAMPYAGAVGGVKYMRKRCIEESISLRFCTSLFVKNELCAVAKADWLNFYLWAGASKACIMTYDKAAVRGTVLIDDKPEPNQLMEPEWEHIVFDQSYNQRCKSKRMMNWDKESVDDIIDHVNNITTH